MLGLLLVAAISNLPELRVAIRAGDTGVVSCTVRDGSDVAAPGGLTRVGAGEWLWRRAAGEVLSCSSPGFEPVDLDPSEASLPPRVERDLLPARSVILRTDWPGTDAVIEWRSVTAPNTWLIARQRRRVSGHFTLPVAGHDRILRVWAGGLSPLSFFIPGGASPLELQVPRLRAGGEIFGVLPGHAVAPVALELATTGMKATLQPDTRRVFQAAGLAPGVYTLVPRYRGGIAAKPQTVIIRSGQTSELLPLDLAEPGAASITAVSELCDRSRLPVRFSLRWVDPEGAKEPVPMLDQVVAEPPCERELDGLDEGSYETALIRAGQPPQVLSATRFYVRPGERTRVTLAAPEVRVTGRLTIAGDRPGAGLALLFERDDGGSWRAQADDSGQYEVALGPAGDYRVSAQTSRGLTTATFLRHFRPGDQKADFELGAGAIHVRVARHDGAEIDEVVELALTAHDGRRINGSWRREEDDLARFTGLDLGEYWVTGRTPSGLASESVLRVALTPQEPAAEVELRLGPQRGVLKVVDRSGLPIAAAEVEGGAGPAGVHGGVVSLDGVPAGEWLRIRAEGYVPVCRVLRPEDLPEMRVELSPATETLTMHFDVRLPWQSGLFRNLPGSDCPIVLNELPFSARSTDDHVTVTVALLGGRYQFALEESVRPVTVPGSDVYFSLPATGSSP